MAFIKKISSLLPKKFNEIQKTKITFTSIEMNKQKNMYLLKNMLP